MARAKNIIVLFIITLLTWSCSQPEPGEIDLSGQWQFKTDELDVGENEKWFNNDFSDRIELPGSMAINGKGGEVGYNTEWTGNIWLEFEDGKKWYETQKYGPYLTEDKFRYPFWLIPEKRYVGPAWYQKIVQVPEDWTGDKVELFLERCHWETQVWVNGKYCGMQNALGTGHTFDISNFIQPGENRISICVDNRVKEVNVGLDAHSITDNTQSNWNGVVGEIKLLRKDPVSISGIKIYPDTKNKTARVEVEIENISGNQQNAELILQAKSVNTEEAAELETKKADVAVDEGKSITTIVYEMGEDVLLWDEFNPNLYELKATISTDNFNHTRAETFGMRELRAGEKSITINDRPVFFRGTLECAIFPKTGFPPTDVQSWERIITICKDHGLNHIRFHSWCPPEAAFIAADKLGFYYQVESSVWATVGNGEPIDEWIYKESNAIVDAYGNHPSFCLMPYGNEPHGENHVAYLTEFVKYWKEKDSRRLYTSGAGWPIIPENEYHSSHRGTRIQGWGQGLNSIINSEPPRTDYNWSEAISDLNAPMISHEIGQWCVYPNFKEIEKYDGVLKPTNFEIFKRSLDAHNMLHLADSFLLASGKLQALCYKADIEAAFRTPGFSGFQLLDLHDFPGQGTALVGILDAFWDEKGYISPKEFRRFCNTTVPLARLEKRIFTESETMTAKIEVAHYGENPLKALNPTWKIVQGEKVVANGTLGQNDIQIGNAIQLGEVVYKFQKENTPRKMTLEVAIGDFSNSWDIWVYPENEVQEVDGIRIVEKLDQATLGYLKNGGKVLLSLGKGKVAPEMGGDVGVGFSGIFWNTAWTNGQKPHTLGILCNPEHPALAEFPTEYHSNWQWWDAMSHSDAVQLDSFPVGLKPIVRIIDDWNTNRRLALLFEAKVGEGSILVSGADLVNDLANRPAARQLLVSLKNYMNGEKFAPVFQLSANEITAVLK